MTDTVRTMAEVLALGTEGIPDSFTYQDFRDAVVSIPSIADAGSDESYGVVTTAVHVTSTSPIAIAGLVFTVPANNTVYWEAFLWINRAGVTRPKYTLQEANGTLASYWSLDPGVIQQQSNGSIVGPTINDNFTVAILRGWSQNFHASEDGTVQLMAALDTGITNGLYFLAGSETRVKILDAAAD